jgi:hypothetical protein
MGILSKEAYLFYTGAYNKSQNEEHKGIIPFNLFQEQGENPLTTFLNPTSNATTITFKLTDIIKLKNSVYSSIYLTQDAMIKTHPDKEPEEMPLLVDESFTVGVSDQEIKQQG